MITVEDGRQRGARLVELIHDVRKQVEQANRPPRRSRRLGYSWIGRECEREIWYKFRWCDDLEDFDGRMLRLFETGELEEGRFCADLRRVGVQVYDRDEHDATEQISVRSVNGLHFGFLDSVLREMPFTTAPYLPCEMKTHNERSFKELVKKGVALAKPEHYAQLMGYMRETKAREGLYLAKNKNTDELYAEFVPYDNVYASRLLEKAERVTKANEPPPRISSKQDFFKCRFCKANAVCHSQKTPPRTCRTCTHSTPTSDSLWMCAKHNVSMDAYEQEQMLHCAGQDHRFLPGLVPGEPTNESDKGVTYKLATEEWVDDGNSKFPSDC